MRCDRRASEHTHTPHTTVPTTLFQPDANNQHFISMYIYKSRGIQLPAKSHGPSFNYAFTTALHSCCWNSRLPFDLHAVSSAEPSGDLCRRA